MGNNASSKKQTDATRKDKLQKPVELDREKTWFVGRISKSEEDGFLSAKGMPNGTFLIRKQQMEPPGYVVAVKDEDQMNHYIVNGQNEELFSALQTTLRSLNQLVHYYIERTDTVRNQLTTSASNKDSSGKERNRGNWEIPKDELDFNKEISAGAFARVYKGKWRGTTTVAIKMLKQGTMSSKEFLREAQILNELEHPHLVKFYGVSTRDESFYIVLEYLENGSLFNYLRNKQNEINEQEMICISSQVASGMKYLEELKIVHLSLTARNVLVGEKISGVPVVKVADFVLAKKLINEEVYKVEENIVVSIKWTAPEALKSLEFTTKSDVWSFGVLLWEIFSRGETPYKDLKAYEVLNFLNEGHKMSKPPICPENVYNDVVLKCWDENPEKRPTFAFLFSYFDDYYT